MRIRFVFKTDFSEEERRALAAYFGHDRKATREEIKQHMISALMGDLEVVLQEGERNLEEIRALKAAKKS